MVHQILPRRIPIDPLIPLRDAATALLGDDQIFVIHFCRQAAAVKTLHIGKKPVMMNHTPRTNGYDDTFRNFNSLKINIVIKRLAAGDLVFVVEHAGQGGNDKNSRGDSNTETRVFFFATTDSIRTAISAVTNAKLKT